MSHFTETAAMQAETAAMQVEYKQALVKLKSEFLPGKTAHSGKARPSKSSREVQALGSDQPESNLGTRSSKVAAAAKLSKWAANDEDEDEESELSSDEESVESLESVEKPKPKKPRKKPTSFGGYATQSQYQTNAARTNPKTSSFKKKTLASEESIFINIHERCHESRKVHYQPLSGNALVSTDGQIHRPPAGEETLYHGFKMSADPAEYRIAALKILKDQFYTRNGEEKLKYSAQAHFDSLMKRYGMQRTEVGGFVEYRHPFFHADGLELLKKLRYLKKKADVTDYPTKLEQYINGQIAKLPNVSS